MLMYVTLDELIQFTLLIATIVGIVINVTKKH